MKKLAGLVVILAILILGSYYGMGMVTERTLKKNIAMIDQSNGISIEVEQYHRGLCKSTAILDWHMMVPARITQDQSGSQVTIPAQEHKMKVPLEIYHGPIMLVDSKPKFGLGYARSNVTLASPYIEQFAQEYQQTSIPPVLNLSVFVNYFNNSTLNAHMPTFKLIAKEGHNQIEWLGMSANMDISSKRDQVHGVITIDGVNLQKEQTHVVLGKAISRFDLHQTNLDMYMGDGDVSVPSLVIMQDNKETFHMQQLHVHSTSGIKEGLLGTQAKITVEKILSAEKTYGPVLLDVSLQNLDAESFAKINSQANELQQADNQKALLMIMPELTRLLGKGARFEISELSVAMPQGTVKGDLLVSLPVDSTNNPFQLVQKLQGHGKLSLPVAFMNEWMQSSIKRSLQNGTATLPSSDTKPVAENDKVTAVVQKNDSPAVASAPVSPSAIDDPELIAKLVNEKLANLVQSGLLSLQGSDYIIELKLANGQFEVNGKPFNSAMMGF